MPGSMEVPQALTQQSYQTEFEKGSQPEWMKKEGSCPLKGGTNGIRSRERIHTPAFPGMADYTAASPNLNCLSELTPGRDDSSEGVPVRLPFAVERRY